MKVICLQASLPVRVFASALLVAILVTTGFLWYHQPALAAYPGHNGKIAFISDRDREEGYLDIYVTSLSPGSQVTRLTNNTGEVWDVHPAWSPDGSRIAFARYDTNDYEIFTMNADGSNVVQLTNNAGWDYNPAWSPDGLRIAYAGNATGVWQIYVMNYDRSNKQAVTSSGNDVYNVEPDWSPDGSKIAFEQNGEICIMNADGSGFVKLTNNTWFDAEPQWHPDGSKLVFTSQMLLDPQGSTKRYPAICVMDLTTGAITPITSELVNKWEPAWSPDGKQIVFQRRGISDTNWEIVIINADGSGFTQLTNTGGWNLHPAWQRIPFELVVAQVEDLVEDEVLTPGTGSSLTNKLDAAERQLSRGNTNAATNSLRAFINQVNGFIKAGKLSPQMGQQLIDSVNGLIARIEGT